jgi:phenylalanyl-tRNA synthetase beta chain
MLEERERPDERVTLGILVTGMVDEHDHRARREADFYDVKGTVEAVFERLGLTGFTFERARVEYLHDGQAAVVWWGGQPLGVLGRLSPELTAHRKLKQSIYVAEIALDRLLEAEPERIAYRPLPRYPSVVRDVSVLVERAVAYSDLEAAIRELELSDLVDLALYDIFTGGGIAEDKHSITIRTTFRRSDRTLTDEEVAESHAKIVDMLAERFGATLR